MDMVVSAGKSKKNVDAYVILPPDAREAIDLLITTRAAVGLPPTNVYLFGRLYADTPMDGHKEMKELAHACPEVMFPDRITSRNLRTYVATVSQVARLLMAVDLGNLHEYRGKRLDDININEPHPVPEDSDGDDDDSNHRPAENTTLENTTLLQRNELHPVPEDRDDNSNRRPAENRTLLQSNEDSDSDSDVDEDVPQDSDSNDSNRRPAKEFTMCLRMCLRKRQKVKYCNAEKRLLLSKCMSVTWS